MKQGDGRHKGDEMEEIEWIGMEMSWKAWMESNEGRRIEVK